MSARAGAPESQADADLALGLRDGAAVLLAPVDAVDPAQIGALYR